MDETSVLSLLRNALMVAGGAVTAGGYMTGTQWTAIVGGVVTAVGVIWDIVDHRKTVAQVSALKAAVNGALGRIGDNPKAP